MGGGPSSGVASEPLTPIDDTQPGPSAGATGKDKDKALPSFWIPSLTPEAKATKLEKPVSLLLSKRPCVYFPREGWGSRSVPGGALPSLILCTRPKPTC